eukprot:CAMPEP_0171926986 /NCGR_PEP_ID=MMETSP0993-20121228/25370_1 /TAXON_ID=483369 /ORGANISM="non described non described, Strain CCMP2098" /LENGTH=351 /DNA_ID=CAMNT_0012565919 /DNA_START=149 /DNA_END=1204 /DNA_ORIENTATION=-
MTTKGYFYADGVDLPPAYVHSVYNVLSALHSMPLEAKMKYAKPHGTYSGPDVGSSEDAYEVGTAASVRSFDYSRVNFNNDSSETHYPTLPGNTTDDSVDGCTSSICTKSFLDDLYERQDRIAVALMVGFAEMLDLPLTTFSQHFTGSGGGDLGTIRLLHYPAATSAGEVHTREKANLVGIAPHTDFEFFTLMHQNRPGLQFLVNSDASRETHDAGCSMDGGDSAGSRHWVDAPVDDAFLVIAGDMLERFTNGAVKALPHRVLHTQHARDSIIRFNALKADTLVAPLDPFVTPSRPARYSPVTMKVHMETTMANLKLGKGAWAPGVCPGDPGTSLTATYQYGAQLIEEHTRS